MTTVLIFPLTSILSPEGRGGKGDKTLVEKNGEKNGGKNGDNFNQAAGYMPQATGYYLWS